MLRDVRKPDDEWVVYRNEIRRNIEDGRYLIFAIVAHTWDFLPDVDGEKHYSCYIREYEEEDDSLVNEYWRGFEISEDHRRYFPKEIVTFLSKDAADKPNNSETRPRGTVILLTLISIHCSIILN